ncbi:MAG: thiamine pyrophosphate-binding protein, partial [Candidatus Nanopelagicales bacterium]
MQVPSPRLAVAIVEELIAGGVRDAVVAPGSRSAPLALALADAERSGLVRLHVRIDERSAGYLALGLARVSGDPVAVITTSGTAAVNVHPAFVEAAYSGVPLIAVTADRPGALRGTGANQTIDQRGIYGVDPVVAEALEGLDERALKHVV